MKNAIAATLSIAIVGCASTSEVIPIGKDTYAVGTTVYSGMDSWAEIKAKSLKSANDYCEKKGQIMTLQTPPKTSGVWGWSPQSAEVTFKCESK